MSEFWSDCDCLRVSGLLTRWGEAGCQVVRGHRSLIYSLVTIRCQCITRPLPPLVWHQPIHYQQTRCSARLPSWWISAFYYKISWILLHKKSFRTKHIIVSVKYPESSWLILKVCGIFVQIGETWHFAVDLLCSSSWPSQTYDLGDQNCLPHTPSLSSPPGQETKSWEGVNRWAIYPSIHKDCNDSLGKNASFFLKGGVRTAIKHETWIPKHQFCVDHDFFLLFPGSEEDRSYLFGRRRVWLHFS